MATIELFSSTCQRTVHVVKEDTPVCPICSAPLIREVSAEEESPPDLPGK